MVRTAGFEPTVKRHFTRKNTSHSVGEPKVNQLQGDGNYNAPFTPLPERAHQGTLPCMEKPETIRYRNLTARITYTEKKGLFLAYWNCSGNKGNASSKCYEKAKEKAIAALKLIHKGQADIANLPKREAREIIVARNLLKDAGMASLLKVATEYISFKEIASEANLPEAAHFWRDSHSKIQAVPFKDAAWDWFNTTNNRWKQRNTNFHEKRLNRLTDCFEPVLPL